MMASTTFIKDTGILTILLLGLLLPSVLVSEQTSTNSSTDPLIVISSMNQTTPGTTHSAVYTSDGGTVTTITQSPTSISGGSSSSTQSPTSTSRGTASSSTLSVASTSGGSASSNTQSPTSTSGGSASSTTQSPTSTSKSTASSSTLSAASTSGGSTSSTTHSFTPTSKGGSASSNTTGNVTTAMSNSTSKNMTYLYCPSFSCSSSECYSMYMSRNATLCAAGCFCQLLRSMDMWYNVSCSASCADSCVNTTQTNCSVNCCNSTGCLSRNFESMMMTTTMASTTKTSQSASTTTSTTVDNGNKCYSGSCTGDSCYSAFKDKTLQTCSSSQPHCQLKKDSMNSIITWTAGCANCTGLATCSSTTQPPCVVECCKASKTSCLLLNGTMNTLLPTNRGPYLHSKLIVSSFCLLAITLLL